jgi:hypothetical protein
MPADDVGGGAAAAAAPFLAALSPEGAPPEAWLLQHGEAVQLGWQPCSEAREQGSGGGGSRGAWKPSYQQAAHANLQQAAAAAAAAAGTARSCTASAAAETPADARAAPLVCRWRVRLLDCVDASPAVVASPAALAGDSAGCGVIDSM